MAKANKKTRRRVVQRSGIRRPEDTGESRDDLLRRLAGQGAPEASSEGEAGATVPVDRGRIRVAQAVFQWRLPKRNMIASDDHILELARVVHESGRPLAPMLLFPIGTDLYVVDGHHRLAAYDTVGWQKPIPAYIFQGSFEAAWRAAPGSNNKNKLQWTREDKLHAAWRIVKQGDPRDTVAATVEKSGASASTVDNMRSVWRRLNDGKHGTPEELDALSWGQARMRLEGRVEEMDAQDWREAEADKIVEALQRARLAGRLTKNPDITAIVLDKLKDGLPAELMAEWTADTDRPFDPHDRSGADHEF